MAWATLTSGQVSVDAANLTLNQNQVLADNVDFEALVASSLELFDTEFFDTESKEKRLLNIDVNTLMSAAAKGLFSLMSRGYLDRSTVAVGWLIYDASQKLVPLPKFLQQRVNIQDIHKYTNVNSGQDYYVYKPHMKKLEDFRGPLQTSNDLKKSIYLQDISIQVLSYLIQKGASSLKDPQWPESYHFPLKNIEDSVTESHLAKISLRGMFADYHLKRKFQRQHIRHAVIMRDAIFVFKTSQAALKFSNKVLYLLLRCDQHITEISNAARGLQTISMADPETRDIVSETIQDQRTDLMDQDQRDQREVSILRSQLSRRLGLLRSHDRQNLRQANLLSFRFAFNELLYMFHRPQRLRNFRNGFKDSNKKKLVKLSLTTDLYTLLEYIADAVENHEIIRIIPVFPEAKEYMDCLLNPNPEFYWAISHMNRYYNYI